MAVGQVQSDCYRCGFIWTGHTINDYPSYDSLCVLCVPFFFHVSCLSVFICVVLVLVFVWMEFAYKFDRKRLPCSGCKLLSWNCMWNALIQLIFVIGWSLVSDVIAMFSKCFILYTEMGEMYGFDFRSMYLAWNDATTIILSDFSVVCVLGNRENQLEF